jgi:hypothetical protein
MISDSGKHRELCSVVFDEFFDESLAFVDAALKYDQTFAVGMMSTIENLLLAYDKSAYTCLLNHLDNVFAKLVNIFDRFVVSRPT